MELQAIAHVVHIGQEAKVTVYTLFIQRSLDGKLAEKHAMKTEYAREVTGDVDIDELYTVAFSGLDSDVQAAIQQQQEAEKSTIIVLSDSE